MKNFIRFLALLLCFCMMIPGLVACTDTGNEGETATEPGATDAPATQPGTEPATEPSTEPPTSGKTYYTPVKQPDGSYRVLIKESDVEHKKVTVTNLTYDIDFTKIGYVNDGSGQGNGCYPNWSPAGIEDPVITMMNFGVKQAIGNLDISTYDTVTITYSHDGSSAIGANTFVAIANGAVQNAEGATIYAKIVPTTTDPKGWGKTGSVSAKIDSTGYTKGEDLYLAIFLDPDNATGLAIHSITFSRTSDLETEELIYTDSKGKTYPVKTEKDENGETEYCYYYTVSEPEKDPTNESYTHIWDFAESTSIAGFSNQNHIEYVLSADGYITFTATGDDPFTYLSTPPILCKQAKYARIVYRTTVADRKGEFFSAYGDINMGQTGSHVDWDWNADGQWNTIVVELTEWEDSADRFSAYRFDALQGAPVTSGDTIDIRYIALFDNEEAANGFDYAAYRKPLDDLKEQNKVEYVDWPQPDKKPDDTSATNNKEGSLTYTTSADGKTVTVTYTYNGKNYSYTVPNNANALSGAFAGTDDLGRDLYTTNDAGMNSMILEDDAGKRYVGLFYFLWLGEHGDSGAFDISKILAEGGSAAKKASYAGWGSVGAMHFFAEPLYGYYYSSDEWVMRKHAELLCNAGVDFLYFDVTNATAYVPNALKLMSILHELNEEGYRAPKIVFYTHTNSSGIVRQVYNEIYSKNLYPDTWFYVNGKPAIVAEYSDNVNDFFTVKRAQWPNEASKSDAWPWMDFDWPQRVFTGKYGDDAISVSIGQHAGTVQFSLPAIYGEMRGDRGRSYDGIHTLTADSYKYGYNFQAQFDRALSTTAKYILVTGWNEWVAQRQPTDNDKVIFVDTCTPEYSRDIEMTRGYYFDNYYMQLVKNIQKTNGAAPTIIQDDKKAINVTGDFSQWNSVKTTYVDPKGDIMDRNWMGFGSTLYSNTTGRNDIVAAKIAHDTQNLYFYVACDGQISKFKENSSWMQLFVNADNDASTGWYGYDYIINYSTTEFFTTSVAKYTGENGAYGFTECGKVSYRVDDKEMMIAVPLSMLGITDPDQICIEFKWADSKPLITTMEDFYEHGDAAPLGRLNWVYQTYIPA